MIDIEKIREYTGADDEFIAMLFNKFLAHLDEDLEELRAQAAVENWANVKKKTHAMLSSARIFHLEEIVTLSLEIEKCVDEMGFEGLHDKTNRLRDLYREFEVEAKAFK